MGGQCLSPKIFVVATSAQTSFVVTLLISQYISYRQSSTPLVPYNCVRFHEINITLLVYWVTWRETSKLNLILPSVTGLSPRLVSNLAGHSTFISRPRNPREEGEIHFFYWIHRDLNWGSLAHWVSDLPIELCPISRNLRVIRFLSFFPKKYGKKVVWQLLTNLALESYNFSNLV